MKADYLILAFKNMVNRQLRSYLTVIGVVIGVTALISLITLGNGLEAGLTEQFDKFGTNLIWVAPKMPGAFGPPEGLGAMTEDDAKAVEQLVEVDFVAPFIGESVEIEYNREKIRQSIFAPKAEIVRDMLENVDIGVAEGRFLEDGDNYVAFIGWNVHKDMFDKEVPLKSSLKINDQKFRVVGIKEEVGSAQEDDQIMVPMESMREVLGKQGDDGITAFSAVLHAGIETDDAAAKITRRLERKRGDENFEVTSPAKVQEQTGMLLQIVTLVVTAIASISLLVGGLGIMNTMYSSVLERTREIGVMKAIGARNEDILQMVLIESGFLGFVGGTLGVLLGLALSFGAGYAINTLGVVRISLELDWGLVTFGLLFAFILGMVSGAIPAIQASKLKPVQALRYE